MRNTIDKINNYLQMGGLFNPELMEHHKVSDLLLECREQLLKAQEALMPFAKEATHWVTYEDDESVVEHFPGYEGEMVVGDLRRAFNVLEEK